MSNVLKFKANITPDEVLEESKGRHDKVIVLGFNESDNMKMLCSSGVTLMELVFILRTMEHEVMSGRILE